VAIGKRETILANPAKRGRKNSGASSRRSNRPKKSHHSSGHKRRSNPGEILGFKLRRNPAGKGSMKKNKSKSHHKKSHGGGRSKFRSNPAIHHKGHHKKTRRNAAGSAGGIVPIVTNAVFVIAGALLSKLGAQAVLGTNNTGLIGYAGNAAVGVALWMLTEHVMKNRAASSGIIAGTVVQILLRVINDYTPFGSYVNQLGMGDYQMQSFVTPQILVDPYNSAQIMLPNGWAPTMAAPAALPAASAAATSAGSGMSGSVYGGSLYGGASSLY